MSISSTVKPGLRNTDQKSAMDRMYRVQRHIYDLTRAYYLLGRDRLIDELRLADGESTLEIGCGTGRNLLRAAKRYPQSHFFGIDISDEMLKTACRNKAASGLSQRIVLAQADATGFDPKSALGQQRFDRIYFSYTLSMIPNWQRALAEAVKHLEPQGQVLIVDFGSCERLPHVLRKLLWRWLSLFGVTPRSNLAGVLTELAGAAGGRVTIGQSHLGYAIHARFMKSGKQ